MEEDLVRDSAIPVTRKTTDNDDDEKDSEMTRNGYPDRFSREASRVR
jgi:hypothetical protein